MTIKPIGPSFAGELAEAGMMGLPFSWSADGNLTFGIGMTALQIAAVEVIYAAHDPSAVSLGNQAAALLAGGLTIFSAGTPAINGIYQCDPMSRATIAEVVAGISAGHGFPGGGSSFDYQLVAGYATFYATNTFVVAAAAVRDFVYACAQVQRGRSSTLPAASVSIA
jgi:hypothetical protein